MFPHVVPNDDHRRPAEDSGRELLRQLGAAEIPYCTLRDPLEGESQANDLDLLIPESCVPRCRDWLQQRGFVAAPSRSPFKMVLLRYRKGRTLCLDIHWKAVQYGIVYMDERRMLERRRVESDGVFHLSAEDELIHLVLHNFLRKGPLRPTALRRIQSLLRGPLDHVYLREHLDAFRLRSAFEAAIRCIQRDEVNAEEAARLRRRLFRAALRARPGNFLRRCALRFRALRSARRRGGLVALIGPDGSGKSTVIKAIRLRARAIPNLIVDTTYLGPWGQMQLSWIPTLRRAGIRPATQPFGLYLAAERAAGANSPRSSPSRHPWVVPPVRACVGSLAKGYLFYGATYVELAYRYLTSVFFNIRKGHWVVSDRYITDLRYLYKDRPIGNYRAIRRLLCMLFPKPDLLIVLDNRSDVIASRKTGLAAGRIEVLRHSCLKAARAYRHEIVTTDRTPEEVADYVLNRMLALRAAK